MTYKGWYAINQTKPNQNQTKPSFKLDNRKKYWVDSTVINKNLVLFLVKRASEQMNLITVGFGFYV